MFLTELIVVVAMIAFNAVFASYEIALASISRARLRRLADEKRPGASHALRMKESIEASFAVVQLGITFVGVLAAAVGGASAEERFAPVFAARWGLSEPVAEVLALTMVVVPLTGATIILGELFPKVFALRNPEWVCLRLSPAMRWFAFVVWPLVGLCETIVTQVMSWGERRLRSRPEPKPETAALQELRGAASLARASRLIGLHEERIILGAAEMRSRPVRDIMLPAEHMSTLEADVPLSANLVAAHLDMHTRFPVVERRGDPQSVIGYVNVKDLIATLRLSPLEPTMRAIVREMPSFSHDTPLAACLERLMREHTHIALVRDESARVIGMISLEDILEELVGEIEDEYDRLPAHLTATTTAWIVGGGASLARLKAATGLDLLAAGPAEKAHTLNDWVLARLGREARGGDEVTAPPARVVIRKVRRKQVQEAQVGRLDERGAHPRASPSAGAE